MGPQLGPAPGARIAVVGACGGIGKAVVRACRAVGAVPVLLDLPAQLAGSEGIPIDVTDPASVKVAFETVAAGGPLHGLVSLAGFALARVPVAEVAGADWTAVIEANLTGAFRVAQAALPLLRASATEAAPTAIVNAASGLATRLLPGYGPYGASKAGLIALTKALAVEEAPLVRANAVAPGAVQTAFLTGGTGRAPVEATLDQAAYVRTIPMGRIATPDDVAGPILFLLSAAACYITGQTLWINGGAHTP